MSAADSAGEREGMDKGAEVPMKGASAEMTIQLGDGELAYTAAADWIRLKKNGKPRANMFYVSYVAKAGSNRQARPITFVFNGGPGASSVFLHLGAIGPDKVPFAPDGRVLPPPYRLENNPDSWLAFTDLVFVDPVGTGFSTMIEHPEKGEKAAAGGDQKKDDTEFWKLKRDLESLGEFIRDYLSRFHRWESPVYIAGESYGGFRTAKLARLLQKEYGVGLSGVVIISPALEFSLLDGSDYSVMNWVDTFPVMAAGAKLHGCSRNTDEDESLEVFMERAERFAVKELLPILAAGDMYGEAGKRRVLNRAADFIGLPRRIVSSKNGRVDIEYYVKNLLRSQGKHLGLYDVSIAVTDPHPDRDSYVGPDPTLHQADRVFAAGINTQLRSVIGLDTEKPYELLSMEVNRKWEVDTKEHALESQVGATDDLRYGMSLNPDMKVFLTHGIFDLVTAYFSAERIRHLMKLTTEQQEQLTVRYYQGGHMFYLRQASREQFARDIAAWYAK